MGEIEKWSCVIPADFRILLIEMFRFLGFLFLSALFFIGGFQGACWFKEWKKSPSLHSTPQFFPTPYPIANLPFTIVIVGKNNGAWLERTLHSVFSQNYPNYRLIYVDDGSDDGSFELASESLASKSNVVVHRNLVSQGLLTSLKLAIETCQDQEIIVVLHGEDRLAHEWVLQKLNQYYANSDLWLTYGQYVVGTHYQLGACRLFKEEESPRTAPFFASHLKTFYAKLFKQIRETDLDERGNGAAEMAMMIPMLEMAEGHFGFIPDVLCVANRRGESREALARSEHFIRSLPLSFPLKTLFNTGE